MAAINDLIRQITDPDLRDRIQKEVDKLAKQKKFGLVFEEHLPECTPLYDIPVRRGVKAALKAGDVSDFYQVLKVEEGKAICIKRGETEAVEFPVDDLVTIAEFGEPIYPYLKPIDTVCNAPDSELWHTLIEADNYHALQLLEYLYAGKVDCIYIDPPYNTGARDWKYNNDYVDTNDVYRHSKWLSFIEKRLFIARRLLNKRDSVLIVTIDEKEYLHLGCLLEEMFPEAQIQMISISINPSGAIRKNMFSRADEYAFVLFFGDAHVNQMKGEGEETEVRWWYLRRLEYGSRRGTVKGGIAQFYPIYIDNETMKIVKIGDPLPHTQDRNTVPTIEGTTTVFPIRDDGLEMNWGVTRETLKRLIDNHVVPRHERQCLDGRPERGYREDGSKIVVETGGKVTRATTVWKETRYDAKTYGTVLLKNIIGDARFSFPKSLYSVADTLRYFVMDKPDALIIDFFAGSGTTLHAVNLLNAEDGGHRRCVIVTNNEVSDTEAKEMTKRGLKPGDEEWEALGIARYVTWPRTVCAIEGHDVNGNPLKGNYLGSDIPMSDGFNSNAIYFKLGFLDKTAVALGMQFKEMLPVLWMKAGAIGKCPEVIGTVPDMLILPGNRFAVLINENAFAAFEEAVNNTPEIQTVFIVTDYEVNYRAMIKNLTVEASYQLYRDYLDNFRINHGRN